MRWCEPPSTSFGLTNRSTQPCQTLTTVRLAYAVVHRAQSVLARSPVPALTRFAARASVRYLCCVFQRYDVRHSSPAVALGISGAPSPRSTHRRRVPGYTLQFPPASLPIPSFCVALSTPPPLHLPRARRHTVITLNAAHDTDDSPRHSLPSCDSFHALAIVLRPARRTRLPANNRRGTFPRPCPRPPQLARLSQLASVLPALPIA